MLVHTNVKSGLFVWIVCFMYMNRLLYAHIHFGSKEVTLDKHAMHVSLPCDHSSSYSLNLMTFKFGKVDWHQMEIWILYFSHISYFLNLIHFIYLGKDNVRFCHQVAFVPIFFWYFSLLWKHRAKLNQIWLGWYLDCPVRIESDVFLFKMATILKMISLNDQSFYILTWNNNLNCIFMIRTCLNFSFGNFSARVFRCWEQLTNHFKCMHKFKDYKNRPSSTFKQV